MKINLSTLVVIGVAAYGANKAAQYVEKNKVEIKRTVASFAVKKVEKVILGDTPKEDDRYDYTTTVYNTHATPEPKKEWKNPTELLTDILTIVPTASIGYDNEGRVIIYTDLGGSDSGVIRHMEENNDTV